MEFINKNEETGEISKRITGHCNTCNSDIIFEWTEPEDMKLIYHMTGLMENFAKETGRCACSLIKITNKET